MDNDTYRLEQLTERYFEASTTIEEERELARMLARSGESSPLIDQARAVMGYAAASRAAKGRRPARHAVVARVARRVMQTAASVALLVAGSALAIKYGSPRVEAATRCVAYIDAVRITDEDVVRQMALDDLRSVMACSASVESQNRQTMTDVAEASIEINEILHSL